MDRITTAIIGLGNIAYQYDLIVEVKQRIKYPSHLSAIKKDKNFLLVAGSDVRLESCLDFKKEVGEDINVYQDYSEMIKKEKPDLVVVASPTKTHVKICKDLIKLGVKNILCEKPISYSLREARSLIDIASKKKVKLAFNYLRIFDFRYQKLIDQIRKDRFGKILSIEVEYSKGIYNTGSHLVNLLLKTFGKVKNVKAIKKISNESDPNIDFEINFKNVLAQFKSFKQGRILKLKMTFEKKIITIDKDVSKEFNLDIRTSMLDVYKNMHDYILGKDSTRCSGKDALDTLIVVDSVVKSLKSKRIISI